MRQINYWRHRLAEVTLSSCGSVSWQDNSESYGLPSMKSGTQVECALGARSLGM